MSFQITGLDAAPFRRFYGLSDEELQSFGVKRFIADEKPGFPDRIEMRDVEQGATGGIAGAPVLIVVCGDTRLTYAQAMDASVFPAVQNLLLAAHALGLGSTLTTLPVLGGDELSDLLSLPPEVGPVAVIPLGHLPGTLGPPRRQPLPEKAHLNRYGTPFPPV